MKPSRTPEPLGIGMADMIGVIVTHGWEIGAFTIKIIHEGTGQFVWLNGIFVYMQPLPVGEKRLSMRCDIAW